MLSLGNMALGHHKFQIHQYWAKGFPRHPPPWRCTYPRWCRVILSRWGGKGPYKTTPWVFQHSQCGLSLPTRDLFFWDCSPPESKPYCKISSHQPFLSSAPPPHPPKKKSLKFSTQLVLCLNKASVKEKSNYFCIYITWLKIIKMIYKFSI